MTREEALKLIEGSSRYAHSILVSRIMIALAKEFLEDVDDWGIVGLLHDLDYDSVLGDMSRHGIVAAEMLEGKIADDALHAIMAHDHRTGVKPRGLLDESLIFADSLAVLMEDQALGTSEDVLALDLALKEESKRKPWISENIQAYCRHRNVVVPRILQKL
jgi:predicted hydrolase (HD superfamily)